MTWRNTCSKSNAEILRDIEGLKQQVKQLEATLEWRGETPVIKYGWTRLNGDYEVYNDWEVAIEQAKVYFDDPDAGYRVMPIYVPAT